MTAQVPFLLVIDATMQRDDTVFTSTLEPLTRQVVDVARAVGWVPSRIAIADVDEAEVRAAYDRADAVVIMGGEDVDPSLYGAGIDYPESGNLVPVADARSTELVRTAIADRTPVFGICRGLQLINVALGGTLIQHVDNADAHRKTGLAEHEFIGHDVEMVANTELHAILGDRVLTESSHHQAVDELGDGLRVSARATDGLVEGIEHEAAPVIAVQWHPESLGTVPGQLEALLRGLLRILRETSPGEATPDETADAAEVATT